MNKRLYVDLDYTIGFHDAGSGSWVVYDGAIDSLRALKNRVPLTLLTANIRHKVDKLFVQVPEMGALFSQVITCEDFAPHFVRLSMEHESRVREGRVPVTRPFLSFLHDLWCEENAPLPYAAWEKQVYFPQIAPNKAKVCGDDGLLVDDEFSNPEPNPLYERMIRERRAFYAGPRGGTTAKSGPDWEKIKNDIIEVLQ